MKTTKGLIITLALVLGILIFRLSYKAFFVASSSMEPTLKVGDRFLVSKFAYRFGTVHRGDVLVFHYTLKPDKNFVKRVVALANETVELLDGVMLINGNPIHEPYLTALGTGGTACTSNYGPQTVPKSQLFVLGDNRCDREDSRFFGFIPTENVVGKALLIYQPPQRIGFIH